MRLAVHISGLDATTLGGPRRNALLSALRARLASMPRTTDSQVRATPVETSAGGPGAIMPNASPAPLPLKPP